jgi:metallo-beta-lactamase family protein
MRASRQHSEATMHPMEIEFFGATREVTGSCHIVRAGGRQIMLECGLVQGDRRAGERNRGEFPVDPASLDAVVLSHAHIDHSGRLPLLVQRGYRGPIYAQSATRDLCAIMLEDSARLAEADAENENRKRARKGLPPVTPIYTVADVERALRQFVPMPYGEERQILPGIRLRYHDAGHILGSASVELQATGGGRTATLVFSGDLGQYDTPILRDPASLSHADIVIMESTYGNRQHRSRDATIDELAGIFRDASQHRGNILIPAFAVGRTQELLYLFATHFDEWKLGRFRIYLDSPMAIRTSTVYWNNPHLFDAEAASVRGELHDMPLLRNLKFTEKPKESQRINARRHGSIIIAGSGMCEGGRIQHHLRHNLWRPESQVIIVGYQAQGTLGRRLVDGNQYVRIHHETIRVRAHIHTIGGLSAHGDQEDLLRWYGSFAPRPPVYLVHGEPEASEGLAARLAAAGAPDAVVAERGLRVPVMGRPVH